MAELLPDDDARALLSPMWTQLVEAAASMPGAPLQIRLGEADGFASWDNEVWVLSAALAGPELHHPDDREPGGLDRFRRAAGAVLEGVARAALVEAGFSREAGWWQGAAVAMADEAAPYLGLMEAARAEVSRTGMMRGRSSAPLFSGGGALGRAKSWFPTPAAATLSARAEQVLGATGPIVDLPVPLPAWCPARVRSSRPGRIADGIDISDAPRWILSGAELAAELQPLPVEGAWDLASTSVPGGVLGARGVTFRFYTSGRVDLLFADAFVGPVTALEMAKKMGHSGMSIGRWEAVSADRIRFGEFSKSPITMHQRDGSQAMPQVGFGVTEWVAAMSGSEWDVALADAELRMAGELKGLSVRLRLVPERV